MYKVILAAIDGSPRSRGVLEAALEIAAGAGAETRVHLFQSVHSPQDYPAAAHMPADDLPAFLDKETRRSLAALAASHPQVAIEAPDMTTAQPGRAILGAAERLNADLIVIGSHGHSGWDRVLATNASRVADFAPRNVLIVHERPRPLS